MSQNRVGAPPGNTNPVLDFINRMLNAQGVATIATVAGLLWLASKART